MFIYLKTTMLRYVTYDSHYLLDNYDYKVRTETKLMRVLPLRQQSFSPASFHSEESMTRSAKGVKGATNFIAMLQMHYCGR